MTFSLHQFILLALVVVTAVGCPTTDGTPSPEPSPEPDASPAVDAGDDVDAGPTAPVAGEACDPATAVPACADDDEVTRLVCDETTSTWTADDCSATFDDVGAGTVCAVIPCHDDDDDTCERQGALCVGGQDGSRCAIRNQFERGTPCAAGLGCVFEINGANFAEVCRPTTTCAFNQFFSGCAGNIATFCVSDIGRTFTWEDAAGVDCTDFDGVCQPDDSGFGGSVCGGEEGAVCMTLDATSVFHCAPGLDCVGQTDDRPGTCQPVADGGVVDVDGGAADGGVE